MIQTQRTGLSTTLSVTVKMITSGIMLNGETVALHGHMKVAALVVYSKRWLLPRE